MLKGYRLQLLGTLLICALCGTATGQSNGGSSFTPNVHYKLFNKAGASMNLVLDRTDSQHVYNGGATQVPPSPGNQNGFPPPPQNSVPLQNGVRLQVFGGPGVSKDDKSLNQHWKLIDLGNGYYGFQSQENYRFYVDADTGCVTNDGCKVQIWSYDFPPPDDATWKIIDAGNGYVRIQNKKSGLLMQADGPDVKQGNRVQLYNQTGGDNELWKLVQLQ